MPGGDGASNRIAGCGARWIVGWQRRRCRFYAVVAFGGAGPTRALHLKEEMGLRTVVVPAAPGMFCVLGAMRAVWLAAEQCG